MAALATIVVLTIVASLVIPLLVDTSRVQALVAASASQTIGRPVRFRDIKLRVFPLPSVELRGVEVAEDPKFGTEPFLTLEKGAVRLRLLPLLTGRLEFTTIVLTQPTITLIQDRQGHWNVATLGASSEPRPPSSARTGQGGTAGGAGSGGGGGAGVAGAVFTSALKIEKASVTYARRDGRDASRYRVEDLDLTVRGEGTKLAMEGTARVRPGDLRIKLAKGTLVLPSVRAPLFDGAVGGTIGLEGKDVADLVAAILGPAPTVAGGLKGTLGLTGTLGAPKIAGPIELSNFKLTETRAACPPPRMRTLAFSSITLAAAWEGDRFVSRPLTTALDHGAITTDLTAIIDRGVRVELTDLAIKTLPVEKVAVDFLCAGYAVTGPLDLTGTLGMRSSSPLKTLSGRGQLRIGPGKVVGPQALAALGTVVGLGGAISSVLANDAPRSTVSSPLEFDSVTATYQIADGVVTTQDLLYTSRAMKVAARGRYALDTGAMNFDMDVDHGRGRVSAKVTGTAASPSIRVLPSSVLSGVDAAKVESGLKDLLKQFGR